MHISHIAIWTTRLEELRNFYITYFNGTSNEKYINPKKGFESYFISFDQGFASLEIMQRQDITTPALKDCLGLAHFSFSVGSSLSRFPARRKFFVSLRKCVPKVTPLPVSRALRETAILKVLFLIPKET